MQIELIPSVDRLHGTGYFEFHPGEFRGNHWSPKSVYLHMVIFELVEQTFWTQIPEFAKYGPNTISGLRIERLAAALDEFAETVSRAEKAEDIWEPNQISAACESSVELRDWNEAKTQLHTTLHDLSQWMRGVAARSEPVSILGI